MESDGVSNVSDSASGESDAASNESDCASNEPDHDNAETSPPRLSTDNVFWYLAKMQLQVINDFDFDDMCLDLMKLMLEEHQAEEGSSSSGPERKRKFIDMGREDGDMRLWDDYFCSEPNFDDSSFRQRFRMSKQVFNRIFEGMLGSIGCLHWVWKNYTGQDTQGEHRCPTTMLEVVASQDLWIWHSYLDIKGGNNDINVLNQSIVFNYVLHGSVPSYHFTANGREYTRAYYLADSIYPEYATLVKGFKHPQDPKSIKFTQRHDSARKDVERAFNVLQSRWAIVRGLAKVWSMKVISDIMLACIIIHNMIVEDEGIAITDWSSGGDDGEEEEEEDDEYEDEDENEDLTNHSWEATIEFEHYIKRFDDLHDKSIHHQLQNDLVEHIWNLKE